MGFPEAVLDLNKKQIWLWSLQSTLSILTLSAGEWGTLPHLPEGLLLTSQGSWDGGKEPPIKPASPTFPGLLAPGGPRRERVIVGRGGGVAKGHLRNWEGGLSKLQLLRSSPGEGAGIAWGCSTLSEKSQVQVWTKGEILSEEKSQQVFPS